MDDGDAIGGENWDSLTPWILFIATQVAPFVNPWKGTQGLHEYQAVWNPQDARLLAGFQRQERLQTSSQNDGTHPEVP